MIDRTVIEIRIRGVEGHHGLDAAIGGMSVCTQRLDVGIVARASVQFVGDVKIQPRPAGKFAAAALIWLVEGRLL